MTRVAILWHMHQPFYQDLLTGEHILPWVRLHALKDYWGMVALLQEFPGVKMTFNLVPSLLVQLEAFARGEARDRHLDLGLKPAEQLAGQEREFCLENFFHAHRPHMIDPYPRYAELLARRQANAGLSAPALAAQFSVEDFRDLQVWHKLAWIDQFYFERDPRVQALVARDRGFSEDDKARLREVELDILRSVIPEYRAAADRGQVELSTSPFYHAILPLLCDTDVYLRTHPHSRMPRTRFRHPEDAVEHLSRAVTFHDRLFGRKPDGLWPSEGSVSDAAIPLMASAGFHWIATDEEILARSLGRPITRDGAGNVLQPELLYRPYVVGQPGRSVTCGFRDHTLSDLIGFTYSSWSANAAADDFVHRLLEAGDRYSGRTGGQEATVFVILDGENAWEHYADQGRPFLRALYARLEAHPSLRTVTMREACAGATDRIPEVFPGSWINADFYIWIGHTDDHRAWDQLAAARRAMETASAELPTAALARAKEELLIAEGSDWFWWYGDDHSSDHDPEFDELFRRHVRNVYRTLEQPIPEELFLTNISTQPTTAEIQLPTGFIEPVVDGEITSYFEWIGAGCVEISTSAGAMHQVSGSAAAVTLVEFGFDLRRLYLRADGNRHVAEMLASGVDLAFTFLQPPGLRLTVSGEAGSLRSELVQRDDEGSWEKKSCPDIQAAASTVLEVAVPFDCLGVRPRDRLVFFVALNRGAAEVEHYPPRRPIELTVPDARFMSLNWTA